LRSFSLVREHESAKKDDRRGVAYLEMLLQSFHLLSHLVRLKHRDSRLLERDISTTIKITTTASNRLDELFWSYNPRDSPSWKSEPLSKTIDDQDIVLVNVVNVLCGTDGGTIAVGGVVVSTIEFIHDESGSITAYILNFGEFGVLDYFSRGIAGVGGEDDGCSSGDLFGDLVRVDMVSICFTKRRWDSRKLCTIHCQHRTYKPLPRIADRGRGVKLGI
jgi:hypothetical protein